MARARPAALAVAVTLAACTSGAREEVPACTVGRLNQFILATARDWYLFADEIPASLDPAAFATPEELLGLITLFPAMDGRDRHFTFLTTRAATTQFFEEGRSLGFGFVVHLAGSRLLVADVVEDSPAGRAGFERGEEILSVGVAGRFIPVAELLAAGSLGSVLGAPEGESRAFEVRTRAGASTIRVATSAEYALDAVPGAAAPLILDRGAAGVVGYLPLRTFVATADAQLEQAFTAFAAAGVTDLVVDLRYNGGGSVSVAGHALDLMGAGLVGEVAWAWRFNASHAAEETTRPFGPAVGAIAPRRVAFLTTGASASASELLVNALQPWVEVAIVGGRTYGKPVGQFGFVEESCDAMLFLVAFQLLNADGTGGYFGGLPDAGFTGATCAAEDDLGHLLGDPAEASLAAALSWLADGTCPAGPIARFAPQARRAEEATAPVPAEPSLAQRHLPGLF
jgi:C-terminal processing protease CtpA/Prc